MYKLYIGKLKRKHYNFDEELEGLLRCLLGRIGPQSQNRGVSAQCEHVAKIRR